MARNYFNNAKRYLVLWFVVPACAALLLGEAYLRVFREHVTPETLSARSLQYESSIFSRPVFPRREQDLRLSDDLRYFINRHGYRGPEFPIKKPSGTVRVIIYGGSSVFDQNASEERDWPHLVGQLLRNSGFEHAEVINAGIPGHATFDAFGRFFSEGHVLEPDYVLLYAAWNDIKHFALDEPLLRVYKPEFLLYGDPRTNYQGAIDRALCNVSQLYVRLRFRYFDFGQQDRSRNRPNSTKLSELALKQYRIDLQMFVSLAKKQGAVPVLMTQARLVSRDNTEKERERIGYHYVNLSHDLLCQAFEECDRIVKSVAASENVLCIDASDGMTGESVYFTDEVHTTNQGSEKLARVTADHLIALLRTEH